MRLTESQVRGIVAGILRESNTFRLLENLDAAAWEMSQP